MNKAKVRRYKTIRKPLGLGWGTVGAMTRVALRILVVVWPNLPILAIVVAFFLPKTPHLRISYTYSGPSEAPIYNTCQYFGIRGMSHVVGEDCPIVRLMSPNP